jgi:hypothetical protein
MFKRFDQVKYGKRAAFVIYSYPVCLRGERRQSRVYTISVPSLGETLINIRGTDLKKFKTKLADKAVKEYKLFLKASKKKNKI